MSLMSLKKLVKMVEKDLVADPALLYIAEEVRVKTIKLVIAATNPKNPTLEYRQLAKDLLRLSGQDWTKDNKKHMKQMILRTLTRLQKETHYFSEHDIVEKIKKNVPSYKVKGEVSIINLHAVLLGGEFMNDQIRAYVDCHHAFVVKIREYLEAHNEVSDKKKTAMIIHKRERAQMEAILETVNFNCCMKMQKDDIEGTPEPALKKAKYMEIYKDVVDGVAEVMRYEGVTYEENAKLFYDPATAVEKRVQDGLLMAN